MKKTNRSREKHLEKKLQQEFQNHMNDERRNTNLFFDGELDFEDSLFDESEYPAFQRIGSRGGRSGRFDMDDLWDE